MKTKIIVIAGIVVMFGAAALAVFLAPIQTTAPTKTPVASPTSTTPVAPTSTPNMKVVTQADQDSIVHLTRSERFLMQLSGTLIWQLAFDPTGIITRVASSTGSQGIYEASQAGTTTLRATGRPTCKAGTMCPLFLIETTITFDVK